MKNYEKVLKYLIDEDNSGRHTLVTYKELMDKFFNGSYTEFNSCLNYLVSNGFVKDCKTKGGPEECSVMLTPIGRSYFLTKRETKEEILKKRLWDLFLVLVGAIVGFILGKLS